MSGLNPHQQGFEKSLSATLRHLACSAPSSAPPELGIGLARAFRRHHFRRRLIMSGVLAAVLLVGGGGIWLLVHSSVEVERQQIKAISKPTSAQPIAAQSSAVLPTAQQQTRVVRKPRAHRRAEPNENVAKAEWFVALPAFALRTPDETLRVVRVEMPASSLRLLGAPVRGEIADRRVNADLLVGPDGTPYAVRLGL